MPRLVGREAELEAVESFLADALHGARTLAILGEAGIGKTTLWDEAVCGALDRKMPVLMARPAESEVHLSFAGLADLLSAFDDDRLDVLPAPQRRALDVALLRVEAERPPEPQAENDLVLGHHDRTDVPDRLARRRQRSSGRAGACVERAGRRPRPLRARSTRPRTRSPLCPPWRRR